MLSILRLILSHSNSSAEFLGSDLTIFSTSSNALLLSIKDRSSAQFTIELI
nr:MAG TPA: hypothetical protein [Caudoviricetes sp.]